MGNLEKALTSAPALAIWGSIGLVAVSAALPFWGTGKIVDVIGGSMGVAPPPPQV
jgi:hypothetical protein